ncbi:MAG: vitamin B12-dependent ribonucleotide reductase [Candidatus Sumerlaeaceae bacterium]
MKILADHEMERADAHLVEPTFTRNAQVVLEKRYLLKDDEGNLIETPKQLLLRVASNIAQAELNFVASRERYEELREKFYTLMAKREFMPNTPTLMNAGAGHPQQLSACFVLPVDDSIESIFESVKHAALIHKTGGGTGFAFSRLRPKHDRVRSTKGVSSGPVSFMKVFNAATEAIKQGGKRRGANMGILRVDHPDILEFIECKADMVSVTNFNISVGVTEKFMEAVLRGDDYELVNPKNGEVVGKLNARMVFDKMVENAWRNGDPGIVFLDRINRDNPTPAVGEIESTNPCGEQPLLPYEACNLGSINLAQMLKRVDVGVSSSGVSEISCDGYRSRNLLNDGTCWIVDWDKLAETVRLCIRFLDDVIEMSDFPLPAITNLVKFGNRKVGLGVMGFADLLYLLGIPYNSQEAVDLGERLMEFIQKHAAQASEELAEERGAFGNFPLSVFCDPNHPWYNGGRPRRNATVTTIAPTGTISIIAGCSSGIEPYFAICFYRRVLDGEELVEVHPFFEEVARQRGFYSEALMREIAMRGSLQEIAEIPADVREVFITAHDVSPKWHLEHQAAFQRHCENAVSKTVNFPNHATREDVAEVYRLAYQKGCKGVTIYRDGSRDAQVLNIGLGTKKSEAKPSEKKQTENHDSSGHGNGGNGHTSSPSSASVPATAAVRLAAGAAQIAVRAPVAPAASESASRLVRRFRLSIEDEQLKRLARQSKLYLTDEKGTRLPLQLVAQEGSVAKGLQLVVEVVSPEANVEVRAGQSLPKCPECGGPLTMGEGCQTCQSCGYSKCG